jgi:hypothetical protein
MTEDDAYCELGDDRRGPSHFPILQPQFRQPARPKQMPTRDRYRATHYGHHRYDDVEDDGSEELMFDSFGTIFAIMSREHLTESIQMTEFSSSRISTVSNKLNRIERGCRLRPARRNSLVVRQMRLHRSRISLVQCRHRRKHRTELRGDLISPRRRIGLMKMMRIIRATLKDPCLDS